MLESSYGSRQSSDQAVINAELTLARYDSQTAVIMALRTRLSTVGFCITAIQCDQHFVNQLIAEYDPISSNYSSDSPCGRFSTISELCEQLHTIKEGGTSEDPVVLLAKQERPKGGWKVRCGVPEGQQSPIKRTRQACKYEANMKCT